MKKKASNRAVLCGTEFLQGGQESQFREENTREMIEGEKKHTHRAFLMLRPLVDQGFSFEKGATSGKPGPYSKPLTPQTRCPCTQPHGSTARRAMRM